MKTRLKDGAHRRWQAWAWLLVDAFLAVFIWNFLVMTLSRFEVSTVTFTKRSLLAQAGIVGMKGCLRAGHDDIHLQYSAPVYRYDCQFFSA